MTECIRDYISFWMDNIIPRKTWCFPNNKPWITIDLKELLNKKKRAFRQGDGDLLRSVQKELRVRLRESTRRHTGGAGVQGSGKQHKGVWAWMKTIIGFKVKVNQTEGSLSIYLSIHPSGTPVRTPRHSQSPFERPLQTYSMWKHKVILPQRKSL